MEMTDLFAVSGKRFLITGGTRGIGRAISLRFAQGGAHVLANYVRDTRAADQLAGEAAKCGLNLQTCRGDLTSPKGLERVVSALEDGRPVDGLIHCAATGVNKSFVELTTRAFDWTFALNVRAFFELTQLILPRMSSGGSIVVLSSKGATRAVSDYAVIGSSKGALEALARNMAVELAPRGIRVNILCPGSVATDAWKAMPEAENRLAEAARRSPIGRLITPEDVACAAQFLCSGASEGIVGHTLVIDGGAAILE